ncbi:hypothetical protein KM043_012187 [Ampulex compressa]|nr:hypothetical protein KM043_012187 [Ampulex compressa]
MESRVSSAAAKTAGAVHPSLETPRVAVSPLYRRNMTPDKRSSGSLHCRICHEDENAEELVDPCECAGTLGLIHATCLEKWLSTSNTDHCEICQTAFVIQRKNKPMAQAFWQWWRSRSLPGVQGIAGDVICLMVLTPLCIAATYLCGIGALAYMKLGFWEGTGLAILCFMLVATYCLWLVVTVRFHYKSWRQWCRRNQDVKLVVKHKSDRPNHEETRIKAYWMIRQDRNNNDSGHTNRFAAWFLASFTNNDDPLYTLQQTSFV